jgi:glycosyltransferase involved in cell wall biosynthesis
MVGRLWGTRVFGDLAGQSFYFLEKNAWQRKIGLFMLRRVTLIKVLGESVRNMLAEKYSLTNTIVMDNGVEIAADKQPQQARSLAGENIEVLHVGVLNRTKGIQPILLSVAELAARHPGIRFTFLGEWGDRSLETWARQYIEEAGIAEHVSFVGLVTGAAKWDHFARADVYLHPSTLDGQPLSILEAMGLGLPVVASRTGAIPDTVLHGRNGLLLDDVDPEHIVAAFDALVANPDLYERISANNLEDFSRRFTLDGFCRNIQSTLERLRDG